MTGRASDPYRSTKKTGMVIGLVLIIAGAALMAFGGLTIADAPDPDPGDPNFSKKSSEAMEKFAQGSIMLMGGFGMIAAGLLLIYITNIRRVARYMATETAPAVEIAGEAAGSGVARGTQRGGGIKLDVESDTSKTREVIKVKCRKCGYLETEDATFCSKCGGKI
jgi:hypothetical protein